MKQREKICQKHIGMFDAVPDHDGLYAGYSQ